MIFSNHSRPALSSCCDDDRGRGGRRLGRATRPPTGAPRRNGDLRGIRHAQRRLDTRLQGPLHETEERRRDMLAGEKDAPSKRQLHRALQARDLAWGRTRIHNLSAVRAMRI